MMATFEERMGVINKRFKELDTRMKELEEAKGTGSTIRGCMFPLDGFPPKPEKIRPMNFYDHLDAPHTKENKNTDEVRCPRCGIGIYIEDPPATPTDDELVDKYCTLIYTNLSLTLRDLVVVRNWLRQFIAEVRKPSIFDKINQTNWGQER